MASAAWWCNWMQLVECHSIPWPSTRSSQILLKAVQGWELYRWNAALEILHKRSDSSWRRECPKGLRCFTARCCRSFGSQTANSCGKMWKRDAFPELARRFHSRARTSQKLAQKIKSTAKRWKPHQTLRFKLSCFKLKGKSCRILISSSWTLLRDCCLKWCTSAISAWRLTWLYNRGGKLVEYYAKITSWEEHRVLRHRKQEKTSRQPSSNPNCLKGRIISVCVCVCARPDTEGLLW